MNIARRFNDAACASVMLGTLAFCLADSRPVLALLVIPVAAAGWVCGRGGLGSAPTDEQHPIALPRALVNLFVLAAIVNAALRAAGARTVGQPIVSHLGEFLVYVQLLKLFDRRTARDESQMLTLSVFVAIAALLTSNTLTTGLCLAIYTPMVVAAAMLYQLRAGQQRIADAAPLAHPFHGLRFGPQLRRTVALSVLAAGILAALVFIITPRGLGVGALGQFGQTHTTEIGFNDKIQLGRAMSLTESTTPVLDLSVTDGRGENIGSADKLYHLRAFTRDEYEPQTHLWVRSSKTDFAEYDLDPDGAAVFPREVDKPIPPASREIQRITLRPSISSEEYLLAAWRPLSVSSRDQSPSKLKFDRTDSTIKRSHGHSPTFTYTVESTRNDVESGHEPTGPLGFATGPIHDLAVTILAAHRIPIDPEQRERSENRQAASAFRDYLQQNCSYTLELWAAREHEDPIEAFLFRMQTGHCEYFASAFVAMCQSVGIHARVVGGFVAGEYNSLTSSYVVRNSNAHAWAEYHAGAGVWNTIDPSPAADVSRIHHAPSGWFSAVRRWWDTLEFSWNRSIVSFDATRQGDAIGRGMYDAGLARWFERISDRLAAHVRRGEIGHALPTWVFYIVPALMLLATLAIATGRVGKLPWRRLFRRAHDQHDPELRTLLAGVWFYDQALRALERAGPDLAKPESLPPLAHADAIAVANPLASDALRTIGQIYYRARFGRTKPDDQALERARAALDALHAALRHSPSP